MSTIGDYIKKERKKAGLTQEDFAIRSGLGLRFVRELEQGKETVRLDKVNQALAMFGKEAVPGKKEVYLSNQYGQPFPVKVTAKDEKNITFDANHEMAGKELNFRIELVEVK